MGSIVIEVAATASDISDTLSTNWHAPNRRDMASQIQNRKTDAAASYLLLASESPNVAGGTVCQ